jgi:hypothetical protein
MSVKDKLHHVKEYLDKEDYESGLQACIALLKDGGGVSTLPIPAQFPVCSSYGLCALRTGDFVTAEEYCLQADSIEAPPAQSQKNLKVRNYIVYLILLLVMHCVCSVVYLV